MDPLRVMLSFLLGFPVIAPDGCDTVVREPEEMPDRDDDDWDDDSWPDYEGEIDMGNASVGASCAVEVPQNEEDPEDPAAGYYQFEITVDGWAGDCWIEMWDYSSPYCEGFDENGDPCEHEGVARPGWWLNQGDYGYDASTGFWDSWWLDLDYEQSWPPDADKSYFTCEQAGNDPQDGDGEFITYFCCYDMVTDFGACVEYMGW